MSLLSQNLRRDRDIFSLSGITNNIRNRFLNITFMLKCLKFTNRNYKKHCNIGWFLLKSMLNTNVNTCNMLNRKILVLGSFLFPSWNCIFGSLEDDVLTLNPLKTWFMTIKSVFTSPIWNFQNSIGYEISIFLIESISRLLLHSRSTSTFSR